MPIICSREAYKTLKSIGANVEYVEFKRVGHDCWDAAFAYPKLLPWLYSQSKTILQAQNSIDGRKM